MPTPREAFRNRLKREVRARPQKVALKRRIQRQRKTSAESTTKRRKNPAQATFDPNFGGAITFSERGEDIFLLRIAQLAHKTPKHPPRVLCYNSCAAQRAFTGDNTKVQGRCGDEKGRELVPTPKSFLCSCTPATIKAHKRKQKIRF